MGLASGGAVSRLRVERLHAGGERHDHGDEVAILRVHHLHALLDHLADGERHRSCPGASRRDALGGARGAPSGRPAARARPRSRRAAAPPAAGSGRQVARFGARHRPRRRRRRGTELPASATPAAVRAARRRSARRHQSAARRVALGGETVDARRRRASVRASTEKSGQRQDRRRVGVRRAPAVAAAERDERVGEQPIFCASPAPPVRARERPGHHGDRRVSEGRSRPLRAPRRSCRPA